MTTLKAISCLALLCFSAGAMPALAEATGQQRAQEAGRAILGSPAPRLNLETIDGDVIDLGGLYGRQAYETAGPDLAVIAINVGFNDSIEAIQTYRKKLGITMPIVFDDGSLGAAFHLRVTPTHVVIGRDGRIQYVGHLADQELDAALVAARTGAPSLDARDAHGAAIAHDDPPPVGVGDLLPKQSLRTLDGRRFEFQHGAAQQKPTVLVFLSPWCESYLATTRPQVSATCRSAREQFSALAADPRLRWLGIASGLWANAEDLRKYRSEYKVTIPLTLDASGEVFRAFRVNDVPTVLIADAGGRVARRIEGSAAQDAAALRTAVASIAFPPAGPASRRTPACPQSRRRHAAHWRP